MFHEGNDKNNAIGVSQCCWFTVYTPERLRDPWRKLRFTRVYIFEGTVSNDIKSGRPYQDTLYHQCSINGGYEDVRFICGAKLIGLFEAMNTAKINHNHNVSFADFKCSKSGNVFRALTALIR